VAVVRVEIRDAGDANLLIELLEVSREQGRDRLLGRATSVLSACRVLETWLVTLTDEVDGPSVASHGTVPDG
jgi:hypothetical protein